MRSFDEILEIAARRKGSAEAVMAAASQPKTSDALAAIPNDRWLSQMAQGIFQAGISWTVVQNKWPGIEEAFDRFDVGRVALMSPDRFDALLSDRRIIRSAPKVQAIQQNAVLIQEVSSRHGSFGRFIADWPAKDYAGLLKWLKTNGARLGGNTGAYMLRVMGKDSYILSQDVVARLVAEGIVDKAPTSARAMRAVQDAFNQWRAESGRNFNEISRVLAQSIDG